MRGESLRSRAGFTLIELLVVISIVGLLIAILLPVLSMSRESANRSACLTSERQVALSFHTRAEDNRGWVNGINRPTDSLGGADGVTAWPILLNQYLATPPDANYYSYNALLSYTATPGCPNVKRSSNALSFGANAAFVGWYNPPMHSLYEVRRTSQILLTADTYFLTIAQWPYALDQTNGGVVHQGEALPPRHNGEGLNVAYVDGHAAFAIAPAADPSAAPWWNPGGGAWSECYGLSMIGE